MNLQKLPSGSWRVTVSYGGQRQRATEPTRKAAQLTGARLLTEMQAAMGPVSRRAVSAQVTVGQLVEMYRDRSDHSDTYHADVERIVKRLPPYIKNRQALMVDPLEVDGWWRRLGRDGWTPHRVQRAHTILSATFTRAIRWGIVRTNPVAAAPAPSIEEHEIDPPNPAAVLRLIGAADADPCFGAFVRFIADTGARRGEALGIRWGDVTPGERPTVTIRRSVAYTPAAGVVVKETKTGRKGRRTITVDASTADALARWKADQGSRLGLAAVRPDAFVFSATGDQPRRPDWATQRWQRLTGELGVSCRLHDLRHAVASIMLERGDNPVKVARRLGHARTSTTLDRYGHLVAVD